MTDTLDRDTLFEALGLVDWQCRPDGALARRRSAGPAITEDEARDDDHEIAAPVSDTLDEPAPASEPARPATSDDTPPSEKHFVATADAKDAEAPSSTLSTMDWDQLEAWLGTQDHRGASRPVFGIGARDADVLIVGEAPGANEDAQGVPFVGRAGKLLDRMLYAIGCSRETNVYITNICKFRPPDNRDPTAAEVAADWPVLERQIDLMQPKLVVAVGRIAAQTLLDCKTPLGKLRGQLHRYPRRELDVLVTYHPAYLLRSPEQKARAWDDLKTIARRIGALSG